MVRPSLSRPHSSWTGSPSVRHGRRSSVSVHAADQYQTVPTPRRRTDGGVGLGGERRRVENADRGNSHRECA